MVMLIDNILSGLGTSSSRSGSTESYTVTRPVSNTPHGRGSTGSYQSGTVSQTKTVTYEYDPVAKTYVETNVVVKDIENPTYSRNNGTGINYTIDADGNLKTWATTPTGTYGGAGNDKAAEEENNTLLYVLLPILALVGVKLSQRYTSGNSRKKRKK